MEYKIPMRIIVVNPPVGVNFALENNGNLVSVTESTGKDIAFDFDAVVKPQRNTGVPNFTGAFAQGNSLETVLLCQYRGVGGPSRL